MNLTFIKMLEDIKFNKYTSYLDYLDKSEIELLMKWYCSYSFNNPVNFEHIIDLMYDLYIREDIDLRPYEEYTGIINLLATRYNFNEEDFLNLYNQFKQILFK